MIQGLRYLSIILLIAFGALSVFLTSSVLLDLFGIREAEGNYVPFIVYANLICGILYLVTAFLLFRKKMASVYPLAIATLVLIVAYLALQVHIEQGGLFEQKTVKAMLIRIVFTVIMTGLAWFTIKNLKTVNK